MPVKMRWTQLTYSLQQAPCKTFSIMQEAFRSIIKKSNFKITGLHSHRMETFFSNQKYNSSPLSNRFSKLNSVFHLSTYSDMMNIETFLSIMLVIHIAGGTIALLSGLVAMLTEKGSKLHRLAGKIYFGGMTSYTNIATCSTSSFDFKLCPNPVVVMSDAFFQTSFISKAV